MARVVPVILAGGAGTRLWPLSREDHPKQFLSLAGAESLLQRTLRRALALARPDETLTVADESHFPLLQDELGAIDPALVNGILLEPVGRNTAAALAYAATVAEERWPGAILWAMPADHLIEDEPALYAVLDRARAAAAEGWIVTLGIAPDRPETGFGYIKRGRFLSEHDGVCEVAEFVEKPALDLAERMIAGRRHLWNSGMLMVRARTYLDELAAHAPAIGAALREALAVRRPGWPMRLEPLLYRRIPAEPFDKAVLERSDRVAVLACDIGWSDVGTWNNLWELMPRDLDDNVIEGPVIADRTSHCLLHATDRLIACTGVHDLAVIETADAVLIADRSDAAGIRRILQMLKAENRPEVATGMLTAQPWGRCRVLHEAPGVRIRELVVRPGAELDLELHNQRQEHWIVTKGTARVTCGDRAREIAVGGSAEIPARTPHRLHNPGLEPLHLIEIQQGALGEDDTVRLENLEDRARAAS